MSQLGTNPLRADYYIAGPMTGLPDCNYPAFHAAAERLRRAGFAVMNPAENPGDDSKTWSDWMRDALAMLIRCERVALLPGWENSRGAKIEVEIAGHLGMVIERIEHIEAAA